MKKKLVLAIVCLLCVCGISVSATLAYLIATPVPVENTFTIGQIDITLDETTGEEYPLIPGATIKKDPKITVKSGSENCFLFAKIETLNGFDTYGVAGVYYLEYYQSNADQVYGIFLGDQVHIKDTLTEEKMGAITVKPVLTITAYAVQMHSIESAIDAWNTVRTEFNF